MRPLSTRLVLVLCALLGSGSATLGQPAGAPQQPAVGALEPRVEAAIARGRRWLEDPDSAVRGAEGVSWLRLYTLLKTGASDEALRELREELGSSEPAGTYAVACALMALVELRDPGERERIDRLARRLVGWQHPNGLFGYPSGQDLSNTQYAALGARAAQSHGCEIPEAFWMKLADGVLGYQDKRGGFGYHKGSGSTGSMTAAGIGTLAICRERLGLGGQLDGKLADLIAGGIDDGFGWLAREFSVTENPQSAGWHYYYLYGLERCGALTRKPLIGEHDWYREGAALLVAEQDRGGSWGDDVTTTCFALLFLRRATRPGSVSARLAPETQGNYGKSDADLAVSLRASGDTPLAIWIERFGQRELEQLAWPGEQGLHVCGVTYTANGRSIGFVPGIADGPATGERFALRHTFGEPGSYSIQALVEVLEPPVVAQGEAGVSYTTRIHELHSEPLVVTVKKVEPAWMRALRDELAEGPLPVKHARASSEFIGLDPRTLAIDLRATAEQAVDGDPETFWLARPGDDKLRLSVTLTEPILAHGFVFAHARFREGVASDFARATRARLTVGGDEFLVPLGPGLRSPTVFVLPEPVRISKFRVELEGRVPGQLIDAVGLCEVIVRGQPVAR